MAIDFELTDDERSFLLHWTYETSVTFFGPAVIWCWNHWVLPAYAPYPLAELYWDQAGREGWPFDRPSVPFRASWRDAGQFWQRANAALALIPRLQGDPRFSRGVVSGGTRAVEGPLTPAEEDFLRAYNREMVLSGRGYHVDLAEQHDVLGHHLIPFFKLLDELDGRASPVATFPWTDFPGRYREVSDREYEFPDFALKQR